MGIKEKKNIIEELEEQRKILELQKKYEAGIIKEEELTEEEKEKLIDLLNQQIETLERNIESYKQTLRGYRDKILEIRKKHNEDNKM